MTRFSSSSKTVFFFSSSHSLRSAITLIVMVIILDATLGFQNNFVRIQNPSLVGKSIPLMTPGGKHSLMNTVFFNLPSGMEEDPLEGDRRQRDRFMYEKRYVAHKKKDPEPSPPTTSNQQQPEKPRLVRPRNANESTNGNERKATTTTVGGVNMELKDPKERVLVRHATASSAYAVDAFKGKKKKIIKPWRSGRKKHKKWQNNTGGLGREAYGEELRVELKNKPKRKRLVVAQSGNADAAKSLISGGSLSAEDVAEERRYRLRKERDPNGKIIYDKDDDEDDYDEFGNYIGDLDDVVNEGNVGVADELEGERYADDNEGIPNLVRQKKSMVRQPEDEGTESPNLVRLSTSMVRQPKDDKDDEPNLVRLSSSVVRKSDDESESGRNLVRLDSSIVKEPEEKAEGELRFYSRTESVDEENDEGNQRLVRAVPASPSSSRNGPKLVRPNFMKERDTGPKLTKPNIVRAKARGPKLVKPNLFREKDVGPKLVRPNIQKKKVPERKLVRPKMQPDVSSNDETGSSTGKHRLVSPSSSTVSKNDSPIQDFMYGANAATINPTSVLLKVKPKESTTSVIHTSTPVNKRPKQNIEVPNSPSNNDLENLMYGSQQASISPTSVGLDDLTSEQTIGTQTSTRNSFTGGDVMSKNKTRRFAEAQAISSSSTAIEDLMYGHQRSSSSPTEVIPEMKPTAFVRAKTIISADDDGSSQKSSSDKSTTIYPDGDKRKVVEKPRLVRASKQKRYVKPSTSIMDSVPDWDAANPNSITTNPTSVNAANSAMSIESKVETEVVEQNNKKYVRPSSSVMSDAPDWDAAQSAFATSNPVAVSFESTTSLKYGNKSDAKKFQPEVEEAKSMKNKKYFQPSLSSMDGAPDWDASKSDLTISNPSVVNVDGSNVANEAIDSSKVQNPKQKKYVQPSASLMDNAPDWDAVQPASTSSNPSVVNVDGSHVADEVADNSKSQNLKKKKYVQPSASSMDNAPDWDAVKPASTSSNPSVVNVDVTKSKAETKDESAMEDSEKKKKYVQPSASLMENAPDWDAVNNAATSLNPSVVNVDLTKSKAEPKDESAMQEPKKKKKYVQPSASLMENAPDWDAVHNAATSFNPSVVNVDITETKPEPNDESIVEEPQRKKYVQPSVSLMENAPDWDAVKPSLSTSNPSVVSVVVSSSPDANSKTNVGKNKEIDNVTGQPKKRRYVKPSVSLMDSAPDWNAVQPSLSTSNPSVVNVDGINRISGGKRLVRSSFVKPESETDQKTHAAPADKPFEYKQVQSIPKENPAGAKPVRDEEAKTKLPASIAHAAGSSSEGWTPSAHFPTDDKTSSPGDQDSNTKESRTRSAQSSTMENYDPDALPRPTGVIPLTVSSSTREKTQLFREEYSLEAVEEDAENDGEEEENPSSSSRSEPSLSEPGKKKLFLYDGGNPQPKELWEFSIDGSDTRLDQGSEQEMNTTKKKLVTYDGNSGSEAIRSAVVDNKDKNISGNGNGRESENGSKLKEKTVSPFTREVSDNDQAAGSSATKPVKSSTNDGISIDAESEDVET